MYVSETSSCHVLMLLPRKAYPLGPSPTLVVVVMTLRECNAALRFSSLSAFELQT
jgi:hypothetical protein